jgi:spore coat polysaccharide biosynthesis predicted glycosyltransferase SpsG
LEYFTFNSVISELESKKVEKKVNRIGIISGGSDPKNTLMHIFDMINFDKFRKLDFFFHYGTDYLFKDSLSSVNHKNVYFRLFNHQNIMRSDLLISAFGVTTYEFMTKGVPIISFGHQKSTANAANILAKETQSIISLGLIDNIKTDILNSKLGEVVRNHKLRKNLSVTAQNLIDLEGVNRVSKILEEINEQ